MLLKLRKGFPSTTESQAGYIAGCQQRGFEATHRQFLIELKAWFDADPDYTGNSYKIAEQADLIESAMIYSAREADIDVPHISQRDRIFSDVFGHAGARIVRARQDEADADVRAFMADTGITDEAEARRALIEAMVGGMEFFTKHADQVIGQADLMQQIEDVIGPVDWRDMGEE